MSDPFPLASRQNPGPGLLSAESRRSRKLAPYDRQGEGAKSQAIKLPRAIH